MPICLHPAKSIRQFTIHRFDGKGGNAVPNSKSTETFSRMQQMNRPGRGGRNRIVEKPKNMKGTLKRIWEYFGSERKKLLLLFALVILTALIALSVPYLIGKSVDTIPAFQNQSQLLILLLILLASAYVLDFALNFFQNYMIAAISQKIVKQMRKALFDKFQLLPVSFFDTRSHGEIMSRVTNDIDNISSTISQSTIQLMSIAITVTGSLFMMLVLNPVLTAAGLITLPLVILLTKAVTKRTSVLFREQQKFLGIINGQMEESISGIHVVKAFNREEHIIQDFEEKNERLRKVSTKALLWTGYMMPMMNVINNLGFIAVSVTGGALAVAGRITPGVISSFLTYTKQFTRPINEIANVYNTLQTAVAGAERVFEIMDEDEETKDAPDAKELKDIQGDIVFEKVCFGYNKEKQILKEISLHALPGSTVALVGPTGAGKTTIINLLTRFYDIQSGSIRIDGIDIRHFTRTSLRRAFSIVLQDTYLFTGTILENISYSSSGKSKEEIMAAARLAMADEFIEKLPDGYDTRLKESGNNLSEGQRQLIAIARAVLLNAPILILDEATSNVDTMTELKIRKAMKNLSSGKTSFVIAHRLSTIIDADLILVIDDGRIMEQGTHDELLAKKGAYYKMYSNQIRNIQ